MNASSTSNALARWQGWTSLVFLPFLVVHLSTQASAVWGSTTYDAVQAAVRVVYQWPPVEAALLGALVTHLALGVVRLLGRRALQPRAKLLSVTGAFLALVMFGHVAATRGASLVYGVFPGFAGLAFTLRWVPAYFWPYYLLLGVSGAVHAALGVRLALARASVSVAPRLVWTGAAVLALCSTLTVLAAGGVFFEVGAVDQSAYADLLRRLGLAGASTTAP
jgi:succinate dehydrogenase/fumarate reductase cytochrome b subunit